MNLIKLVGLTNILFGISITIISIIKIIYLK